MNFTTTMLVLVALLCLIAVILLGTGKKKELSENEEQVRKGERTKKNKWASYLYRVFRAVPGLRAYLNKIETKTALLYPSDTTMIRQKTTQTLIKVTLTLVIGVAVAIIMAGGNIIFIIAGSFVALILVSEMETNAFNKIENTINLQLIDAIDKINHNFSVRAIPDLALQKTIETMTRENHTEIVLHLKTIKDIITSQDRAAKIDEFSKTCPNRHLMTLLMIFTSIAEYGDVTLEKGNSLFEKSLQDLKRDVQETALEALKTKNAFKSTTYLCLAVVLLIRPLEMWATNNMPEIAKFYTGIYGVASMIGMVLISFACYVLVINLRDGDKLKEPKTTSIWLKISKWKPLNTILTKEVNRNFTKYERINSTLRQSGDRTGIKAFLTQKIILAIALFIVTLGVCITGVAQQKAKTVKNFAGAFEDTITPSEEYKAIVEETAESYSEIVHANKDITREDLVAAIKEEEGIKKSQDAEIIADLILSRNAEASGLYFKWYYLALAYLMGIGGFFIPNYMLRKRREAAQEAMEEEILNYQSLAIILMNVQGTTLETFLTWIKRFSYCFTPLIAECQRNLSMGAQVALEDFRIKAQEEFKPLGTFVESLEEIDRSGVERAFSSTQANMEYIKLERRERRDDSRRKKAGTATMISLVPLYGVIGLQLLVPCILMVQSMSSVMHM